MNERAPLPETPARPESGRVLLVAPHPDDDVIGVGGTMALHADAGDEVHVLIFFNGLMGDADRVHDPEEYVLRRQEEARAGGKHLGLERYTFWGYPEGHVPADEELISAARRFAAYVHEVQPDIIYAPWIGEYHLDHHILARIVRVGLGLISFPGAVWGYEVWTPLIATRIIDVSELQPRKLAALREHKSQFEYHEMDHKTLALSGQRAMYCDYKARHAEAFAPFGPAIGKDAELVERIHRMEAGAEPEQG